MADNVTVQAQDVIPVRSRISWGAIFAGAVVAMATYLILTLLGGAMGLTISDNVRASTLATGAGIWAVLTTIIALFLGGVVTSQCTVGENKMEAVIHGVIMWGVVLAMILWLASAGMRAGFSAMWGVASFTDAATRNLAAGDWEAAARNAGVPQARINEWRQQAETATAEARRAVEDPANQQAVVSYATQATWYTLLGTMLSLATAVVGALVGAGPTFHLIPFGVSHTRAVFERAQPVGPR